MSSVAENGEEKLFTIAYLCWGASLCLLAGSALAGAVRLAIYLKRGSTPHSLCATSEFFDLSVFNVCTIDTDWIGFNKFYGWAMNSADASVGLLAFAGCLLVVAAAVAILGWLVGSMGRS